MQFVKRCAQLAVAAVLASGLAPLSATSLFAARPAAADVAGTLDPNFGAGGQATTSFPLEKPAAKAVVSESNGNIVVAGQATAGGPVDFVARYLPSGQPDPAFGGGDGFVVPSQVISVESMAVQADHKIVLGGSIGTAFAVERLAADGTLDTNFG